VKRTNEGAGQWVLLGLLLLSAAATVSKRVAPGNANPSERTRDSEALGLDTGPGALR